MLVPIRLATIERQTVSLEGDFWRGVMDATEQEFPLPWTNSHAF